MVNPRVLSFKVKAGGATPLVIWAKTAEFLKITYAKNADSPDISKSSAKLTRTVKRRKIMDMDEVKAVVKATEEVGVATVRAEACDLRKTSDLDDPGAYYVFSVYETDYLFNQRPNAKFEDVLNFSVNDTNVGLVVDSGAFYDMMSETDYNKLKGKIRLEKCSKSCPHMRPKTRCPYLVSVNPVLRYQKLVRPGKLTLSSYQMHKCLC